MALFSSTTLQLELQLTHDCESRILLRFNARYLLPDMRNL
jgi:hypothetical protein